MDFERNVMKKKRFEGRNAGEDALKTKNRNKEEKCEKEIHPQHSFDIHKKESL